MKALSIRQPWAWLVCKGYKDIDNRTWWLHVPPLLNYPEHIIRIYVHAGKIPDVERVGNICENELYILKKLTESQGKNITPRPLTWVPSSARLTLLVAPINLIPLGSLAPMVCC